MRKTFLIFPLILARGRFPGTSKWIVFLLLAAVTYTQFLHGFIRLDWYHIAPFLIFAAVLIPNLIRAGSQAGNPATASNPAFAAFGLIIFSLVFFLLGGCYEILMLKYRSATLGKMACGLRVIRSDGRSLSWGLCFGRFFMWNVVTSGIPYLNSVLMLVSGIMLGVDHEKRALHDRVCDTRVIYKQSVA